jgi:hypothetical protein
MIKIGREMKIMGQMVNHQQFRAWYVVQGEGGVNVVVVVGVF